MNELRRRRVPWISLLIILVVLSLASGERLEAEPDEPVPAAYLPLAMVPPPELTLVPNGGFESGPVVWQQEAIGPGAADADLIVGDELSFFFYPYAGDWVAYLGGDNEGLEASLWQTVTVPENKSWLGYWYWIDSLKECPSDDAMPAEDYLAVEIGLQEVHGYELCSGRNTGGWRFAAGGIDLSDFVGAEFEVRFRIRTVGAPNESDISVFLIDNVGWFDGS